MMYPSDPTATATPETPTIFQAVALFDSDCCAAWYFCWSEGCDATRASASLYAAASVCVLATKKPVAASAEPPTTPATAHQNGAFDGGWTEVGCRLVRS